MKFKILTICLSLLLGTISHADTKTYHLEFDENTYKTEHVHVDGKDIEVRAYINIVYVKHPADIKYEVINIYIPEQYFKNDSINGYNANTAPIFFQNNIGGYMPATPATLIQQGPPMGPRSGKNINTPSTLAYAISQGYVAVSPGARGRTDRYGKAPAAIIDLKAAVRYLKYNDRVMPGDANKIISNGTSAGGAMSALLGATGDNKDYIPYLNKLGAAQTSDKIFAVSSYCPITNLDHADMAYEWQLNQIHDYKKMNISMLDYKVERKLVPGVLNSHEIKVSNDLKNAFPQYLNTLKLYDKEGKLLTLDRMGNGSFKNLIKDYLIRSAQSAIDSGKDLSSYEWIKKDGKKVVNMDFNGYLEYLGRAKTPPAFDALDLSSGENEEFGNLQHDKQHFTSYAFANNQAKTNSMADKKIIKMMNPMNYLNDSGVSQYWRIRHGAYDKDTSLAIPTILAIRLENKNKKVDFALPWGVPHSGDYDLNELFSWVNQISRS